MTGGLGEVQRPPGRCRMGCRASARADQSALLSAERAGLSTRAASTAALCVSCRASPQHRQDRRSPSRSANARRMCSRSISLRVVGAHHPSPAPIPVRCRSSDEGTSSVEPRDRMTARSIEVLETRARYPASGRATGRSSCPRKCFDPLAHPPRELQGEVPHQRPDVIMTFAKRWAHDRKHVEPV